MYRRMRRFKQELPIEESKRILLRGKECVLAVGGDDNYPYAVPINYAYDGGDHIYLHSATAGHKIDAICRNPKVSLCVIDKDEVVPEEFTTYFRSVIVFGHARLLEDEDEKIEALRALTDKYIPGIDPTDEINRFIKVVSIIDISIDKITGKEAKELMMQHNNIYNA
ncbi:MAG: pyridoxamine 5'-phosphate oxidase family protein, partial [Muribaculaceae bacterium]|nr:pyridoxamine 5'-phosphate oxidase family protein [Muribaculaceae bacterium]